MYTVQAHTIFDSRQGAALTDGSCYVLQGYTQDIKEARESSSHMHMMRR